MRLKTAVRLFPRLFGANSYLGGRGYIFLIGHMRSYSSLLGHILGSHVDIAGYAEMHQKYRNIFDLIELAKKVEETSGKTPVNRYVFDKILHPLQIHDRILNRSDLDIILIARRPEPTITSILDLKAGGITTIEAAIDHYVAQLAIQTRILHSRAGAVCYMDAETIIEKTDCTLTNLATYLGITPTLSENYSIFQHTGAPKFGDPTERIKTGKVIKERSIYPTVKFTKTQSQRLSEAYLALRQQAQNIAEISIFAEPDTH